MQVNNLQCLNAEKNGNHITMMLLINGEERKYEVPFEHLTSSVKGFDFPEEVRRILRTNADASRALVRLLSDVVDGLSVSFPAVLIVEAVPTPA